MRTSSLRHGSFSSASLTATSSSSNPFPRPQSRHTANTSVDLLPLSATIASPCNSLSLPGSCGPPSYLPLRQHTLPPPGSEEVETGVGSSPSRGASTYANGAFNLDDYLSTSEEDVVDMDAPLSSALAPRRHRNPKDEEALLFRNSGYGAGGVAQLPGLFEPLPDATSTTLEGLDQLHPHLLLLPSSFSPRPATSWTPRPASAKVRSPPISRSSSHRRPRTSHDSPSRFSRRVSLDIVATTTNKKPGSGAALKYRLTDDENWDQDDDDDEKEEGENGEGDRAGANDSVAVTDGGEAETEAYFPPRADLALGRRGTRRISALGEQSDQIEEEQQQRDRDRDRDLDSGKFDVRLARRARKDAKARRRALAKVRVRPTDVDVDEVNHADVEQ